MPRTLLVRFSEPISVRELPAFRGAVITAVGATVDNLLFHQHKGDGFHYAYPLIQYKRLGRRPALLCLETGADELYKLFQQSSKVVSLNGRDYPLDVDDIRLLYEYFQINETPTKYLIQNWAPLNQRNYTTYQQLTDETERIALLSRILVGNLLVAARGLDIFFDQKITVELTSVGAPKLRYYKNIPMLTFDAQFFGNLSLPRFIGLGQHAGLGYGVTTPIFSRSLDLVALSALPEISHEQ